MEADCILDCGNAIKADGDELCYAESDALGYVRFTDLAMMNEETGAYRIDFTLDNGATPTENTDSGFVMNVELGLSRLMGDNFGLHPSFMSQSRRTVVAGVPAVSAGAVAVELRTAIGELAKLSRVGVYAVLIAAPGADVDAPPEMVAAPPISEGLAAVLREGGDGGPTTCCKLSNCNDMVVPGGNPCCNCSLPECSLCQVPFEGIVKYEFTFRRSGRFNIHFRAQTTILHEFAETDVVINVVAVRAATHATVCTPTSFVYRGMCECHMTAMC